MSENLMDLHNQIADSHLKLQRNRVWCHSCGNTQQVNSATALRYGWPECCGYTMSLDSPEERKALTKDRP